MTKPADVTTLLQRWRSGEAAALAELIPLVYEDLRHMARRKLALEGGKITLQPTALVHEVYLHLAGDQAPPWNDRAHFFAVASTIMRRILVDYARQVRTPKRGGGAVRLSLDESVLLAPQRADELLALDQALAALAERDPRRAKIVEMRFFGGMTIEETAEALGTSIATVVRGWRLARAWLYREVNRAELSG